MIATCHGLGDKGRKGSEALRKQLPGEISRVGRELAQAIEIVPVERDAATGRAAGQVGARLATYLPNYCAVVQDERLQQQARGAKLSLVDEPELQMPSKAQDSALRMDEDARAVTREAIKEMVDLNSVRKVEWATATPGVVNPIFTVPKKECGVPTGEQRPIVDCRPVNAHLEDEHFKMQGLKEVKDRVRRDVWFTRLDLTKAYWTVPLAKEHAHLVRFIFEGELYEAEALQFGISSAPRLFSTTLQGVVDYLRSLNLEIVQYMDDLLFIGRTAAEAELAIELAAQVLEAVGFLINAKKSEWKASRVVRFLGIEWDSHQMIMRVPASYQKAIKEHVRQMKKKGVASARELSRLLGILNWAGEAMFSMRLHSNALRHDLRRAQKALRHDLPRAQKTTGCQGHSVSWDRPVQLSAAALDELDWWQLNMDLAGHRLLGLEHRVPGRHDVRLETDASPYGWGAVLRQPETASTGGWLSAEEQVLHQNVRELLAVEKALHAYFDRIGGFRKASPSSPTIVRLWTDNTTVLRYVNAQGGRYMDLSTIAVRIWEWCSKHNLILTATHIAGDLNVTADAESRELLQVDRADWAVSPAAFAVIDAVWGPHTVDMFASAVNAKLPTFFSWKRDPQASAVDAFLQDWSGTNGWCCPPWVLIPKVLAKVQREQATVTIIAPLWSKHLAMLSNMSVDWPVLLSQENHFEMGSGDDDPTANRGWKIAAWRISGIISKQRASPVQHWLRSATPGPLTPMPVTSIPGMLGSASLVTRQGWAMPMFRLSTPLSPQ
jgi:hypothetical protein